MTLVTLLTCAIANAAAPINATVDATVAATDSNKSTTDSAGRIRLDIRPRICTLSGRETQCETPVRAVWRSPQQESLCLVIANRPEIKRCWDKFSKGSYSVELVFNDDILVELRDPQLQNVLASKVLQVIREALEYRRKRRQPWNLIY